MNGNAYMLEFTRKVGVPSKGYGVAQPCRGYDGAKMMDMAALALQKI